MPDDGALAIILGKAAQGAAGPMEPANPNDRGTPDAFADENLQGDLEVALADFLAAESPQRKVEALMNFMDIRDQLKALG